MKIYVGHSKRFDFKKDLYEPLRKSNLNENNEIIFPHERGDEPLNSKKIIKECKLMIAEVSYPSTGLGVELGWASDNKIPIICIYKKGSKIAGSLKIITNLFLEYLTEEEMISGINDFMINI